MEVTENSTTKRMNIDPLEEEVNSAAAEVPMVVLDPLETSMRKNSIDLIEAEAVFVVVEASENLKT